jgi:transposase
MESGVEFVAAVARPTMRFVGVKTPEQQSIMMLHRVRLILMRQLTQLSNALRSHLAEFGNCFALRPRRPQPTVDDRGRYG